MPSQTRSNKRRTAPSVSHPLKTGIVTPGANDRVWHQYDGILPPQQVARVLRGVIDGDPLAQENLFNSMMQTWPDLGQAINQVCDEVARAPMNIVPYAEEGLNPSAQSQAKAAVIRGLKGSMRSEPNSRREGWAGTIKGLAMGYFYGLTVREVFWEISEAGNYPVSTEEYAAIYYRYPRGGDMQEQLLFSPHGRSGGDRLEQFDPNKHLVGENRWHRGSVLQTAPLRALVPYWIAKTYGLKWFLDYGQTFGVPFRMGTYPDGDDKAKAALNGALANLGSASWGSAPSGTSIDIIPIPASASALPQKELIDMANNAVAKFILGQTLTSDVGDSGSRALGNVHETIRKGRIEGVVAFVTAILNNQLIPAVIRANWADGQRAELPVIVADWPSSEDAVALAERDEKLIGGLGLQVTKKYLYERHNVPIPEDGEELFEPGLPDLASNEPIPASDTAAKGRRKGPGSKDAEDTEGAEDDEPATAKAQRAESVSAANALNTATLAALQSSVERLIPGIAREWLAPAGDLFDQLISTALDEGATPAEFERVVVEAAAIVPDLVLDPASLQDALANAIGTAMIAGAGQRALDTPVHLGR